MTGKAGLRAGLIGAGIMLVVTLLSQIPFISCICCALTWLVYAGIGALAGNFLPPPRNAGTGAGAGAIAGLISGAAGGIVWIIVMAIQMVTGSTGDVMPMIDAETMRQLVELGIDPEMFAMLSGTVGAVIAGGMCCLMGLATGAGMGAIGGAIFAAAKSE